MDMRNRGLREGENRMHFGGVGPAEVGPSSMRIPGPHRKQVLGKLIPILVVVILAGSSLLTIGILSGVAAPALNAHTPDSRRAFVSATGSPPELDTGNPSPVAGEPFAVIVYVYDPDNDNVNVTFDFGDGSPTIANMSDKAGDFLNSPNVTQYHTWNPVVEQGTGSFHVYYTLTLTGDDGNGNTVVLTKTVDVFVPPNAPPEITLVVPTGKVDPNDNVNIVASAYDGEGESLNWTFIFNDSAQDFLTYVNYTGWTAPNERVWNNVTHVFGVEGNYTVTLYVTDALPGKQVFPQNKSVTSTVIEVAANKLPKILDFITVDPAVPVLNVTTGLAYVNYTIEGNDEDGDVLNATWDFGDGSPPAWNESAGGTGKAIFRQMRIYNDTGTFNVTVVITDGRPGHDATKYVIVNVTSTNMPPGNIEWLFRYPMNRTYAHVNETLNFTLIISEPELNPIELIVDFGDNSPLEYYNLTDFVDHNVTLELHHSYAGVGRYFITIQYTDNKVGLYNHSKVFEANVVVDITPPIEHAYWDWWDYTGLGIFMMFPVLIGARMVLIARRRRELEEQGMTLEEYKLLQSEKALDTTRENR